MKRESCARGTEDEIKTERASCNAAALSCFTWPVSVSHKYTHRASRLQWLTNARARTHTDTNTQSVPSITEGLKEQQTTCMPSYITILHRFTFAVNATTTPMPCLTSSAPPSTQSINVAHTRNITHTHTSGPRVIKTGLHPDKAQSTCQCKFGSERQSAKKLL